MEWISTTVSVICLIYAALPLIALIVIGVRHLRGKILPDSSWTTIIDFGKWYLVSVALVLCASLIKDGITERETGLKEMESFQKYTDIITEKGGIEKRWELSNYFAAVTPTKRLKEGWKDYRDAIRPAYDQFMNLPKKEDSIKKSNSSDEIKLEQLAKIDAQRAAFQAPLVVDNTPTVEPEWVIILTTDTDLEQAKFELKNQRKIVASPRLCSKGGLFFCVTSAFGSKAEAEIELSRIAGRFPTSNPRVINLKTLCSNPIFNGEYYECK